jgi:hypothetical protein
VRACCCREPAPTRTVPTAAYRERRCRELRCVTGSTRHRYCSAPVPMSTYAAASTAGRCILPRVPVTMSACATCWWQVQMYVKWAAYNTA